MGPWPIETTFSAPGGQASGGECHLGWAPGPIETTFGAPGSGLRRVGPEGPVVALEVARVEVARPVVLLAEVGDRSAGLLRPRVQGVDLGDRDVEAEARRARALGHVLEVLGARAEHDHAPAQAQLGVGDRAIWVVDALRRLEAEHPLEPVDRRGGVAVAQRGIDRHAYDPFARSRNAS